MQVWLVWKKNCRDIKNILNSSPTHPSPEIQKYLLSKLRQSFQNLNVLNSSINLSPTWMQAALCCPTRATRGLVSGRCLIARSTRRCSSKLCDWSGFQLRLLPPQSGVSGKLLNKFVCLIQYLRHFVGPTVYYQKRRV